MDVDDDVFGIDMERFGSLGTLHQRERERASERKANDMDKSCVPRESIKSRSMPCSSSSTELCVDSE